MKSVVAYGLIAGLSFIASPAAAQEQVIARVMSDVCLPYANRALSFEKSIAAARDLQFRRPVEDTAPLEEWASEVELVSRDGVWRLRIEEGTVERDGVTAYALTCSLGSRRANGRGLAELGRRAFRNDAYWTSPPDNNWRWDRRHPYPDEYALVVEVTDLPGSLAAMIVTGAYF